MKAILALVSLILLVIAYWLHPHPTFILAMIMAAILAPIYK